MSRFSLHLKRLREENRLRHIPETTNGLIDLVSNDYLGIAAEESELHEEFFSRYPDALFSSSASRLLSRRNKYHNLVESTLEGAYRRPVLVFNSGYHANTGVISAIASPETVFFVDALMHASGWDGLRMAQFHRHSEMIIFPHNDISALKDLMAEKYGRNPGMEAVIITESIFSMDGDLGKLTELVELKHTFPNVLLYVDEAHGFGVRGNCGLGLLEELDLIQEVDIIVGTFGKAAASVGAFVVASPVLKDFILNYARSFIFSTALPPVNMAWTLFTVSKIFDMSERRRHLLKLSHDFGKMLSDKVDNFRPAGESQIIPYLCGSAEKAISLAALLRRNGFDVLPIRRPTVPPGGERLRFSLNATLSLSDLSPIPALLT